LLVISLSIIGKIFFAQTVNINYQCYNYHRYKELQTGKKEGGTIEETPPCRNLQLNAVSIRRLLEPEKTLKRKAVK
jgi:hypothetical protein